MRKKVSNDILPDSASGLNIDGNVQPGTRKRRRFNGATRKSSYDNVKIIATGSSIPFSGVPLPYSIEWDDQLVEFQEAMNQETPIYLVPLRDPSLRPSSNNLAPYGVEMKVMKIIDLPDGKQNVFMVGEDRVEITAIQSRLSESCFVGAVRMVPDSLRIPEQEHFNMLMNIVKECYDYIKSYISEMARVQMAPPKDLVENNTSYLNFIIVTSPIDYEERLKMLGEENLVDRAESAIKALDKIRKQIELRKEIFDKTAFEIEKEQREHFLRSQIRQIQSEIGEDELNDFQALEEKAQNMKWNSENARIFQKELNKLRRYNPTSPDYAIQYTYLETLLNLPWDNVNESEIDLQKLEQDLEKDHYGLHDIKERIIEHMAVLKLRGDMRSPILCFYGPPGVGKTSLCRAIADSIGRDYTRVSLGGLHDETQIRGHRRTYIGALPGRIISSLEKLDTNNPVFVLDEIDKLGNDHRGDPGQALLEVLDPEQNSKFHDNYIDIDYDLSKVFFIATANTLNGISAPLLDRMELIEVSGYLPEEKVEIAKRHLVPKQLENHGFKKNELKFTDEAILTMIDSYTRESGVRKLEKTIAKVIRKIAVQKVKGEKFPKKIDAKKVKEILGKEEILPSVYESNLPIGVATGLAWTAAGGEILYFETSLSKGKGNLSLTGNLGDVMKESATIAYQWVKANAEFLNISPDVFQTTDVHLHVPEGAVPKDGPSAGITMISSIASAFTGRKLKERLAMTGEATLSGKVLPVGGIKEKILAAKRAGITDIILSEKNTKDIKAIESKYIEGLNLHFVETIGEVINLALES